ncbi:MAG: hypothetical protein M1821_005394 [Bathelium mastoideum]|nr:MAG: hypothetical protein M1821_005394 [Bathelium mastoideum]
MEHPTEEEKLQLRRVGGDFPPSPPETEAGDSTILDPSAIPLPPPSLQPTEILKDDRGTPDGWLPRDPRLIRLTGKHPFNVEAPLSDLYNEGFLTSPELFYVRNHGAVPHVKEEDHLDWELTVEGLVENPLSLTLRDLLEQFGQVTYPVTFVCAGNRRKEQNVVRKTKGFSWGAAGVSTAIFTGVAMSEVLKRAKPFRKARYVCMEGADQLPNGYYGTSVKLNWVLDPNRGMMLAHKMNGETLRPDHGQPLRAVIPGQIGGRSVKWLKRIILTDAPSENWYHIYDNRVLPTSVSPEESQNNPDWWKDERYAIYDLSTNSAIAYPAHNERLSPAGAKESYDVRGYAYGGGGRRVTRVEVTLDKGRSWRLASIDYLEDRYREAGPQSLCGGSLDMSWRESCFCWCFWNIGIPIDELRNAQDIAVRAMDESMNIQPRDMYWSVLGMMNNPWYRIAITEEEDCLRFEHPTQPALIPGGWMERVKKAGGDLTNGYWGAKVDGDEARFSVEPQAVEMKMTKDGLDRRITLQELRQHESGQSPWFVLHGEVYDGTGFLKEHPGGAQSIISAAGVDSTEEFMAIHSENAKGMMPKYHIGSLTPEALAALNSEETTEVPKEPRPVFLSSKVWSKAALHSKRTISWDTRVFTFKLEHDDQVLGLPIGQHLMIKVKDAATGEATIRSYTPISETEKRGSVDVLVKVYFDTQDRSGGKMTQAMDRMPSGCLVDFKGPTGKFEYLGGGRCSINGAERKIRTFVMICGGSGITPIFQVLRAVMRDRDDPTKCIVLNGNRLVEDILCKEDLDQFETDGEGKCSILYTLTKAPSDWNGLRGRIAKPLLEKYAQWSPECMALICGPEAMEQTVLAGLKELGWSDQELHRF